MARRTILRLALILCFMLTRILSVPKPLKGCIAKEHAALLSFKEGLEDTSNRLSTWTGDDCCVWKGITCSKKIGHVVRLDLRNTHVDDDGEPDIDYALGGNLSSSLLALRHLNYLDLSSNYFNESQIPEFIGSMSNLRYLNLRRTSFIGSIPPQLGNLSNLIYLDLSCEDFYSIRPVYSKDLAWLPHLPLLEYLDMSYVNISTVANWAQIITMLPSLKHLYFSYCSLQNLTYSPSFFNLSNLVTLDISGNSFGDTTFLNLGWNLTSLKYLDMSGNSFGDKTRDKTFLNLGWNLTSLKYLDMSGNSFGDKTFLNLGWNLTSLKYLDMSINDFNGILPGMFNNLCNIKELDLSYNPINIDITELVHVLPQCLRSKLQSLNLEFTNLIGNLSSLLEHMTSLRTLNLRYNNLTGPIPYNIRAIKLSYLDLGRNFLDGAVSKDHFVNLLNLQWLLLYENPLIVDQNWVPPVSLRWVNLKSCKLGPKFPPWIRRLTNIIGLDISNTSIVDKVPEWFWNTSSHFLYLDLSNNQISGKIHKALQVTFFTDLYLQNNLFEGPIPPLPKNLINLDLSNNSLSGPLPSMFRAHNLTRLFLQKNLLNGTIPASICQLHNLWQIDLSSNLLTGHIPMCWTDTNFNTSKDLELSVLILRNNSLAGTFPFFLKYCQGLVFLDLSYNEFSGNLPSWIGEKLSNLLFLFLRSNMFSGNIPVQITNLYKRLQILDLAHNNFSGSIPAPSVNDLNLWNDEPRFYYSNPLYISDPSNFDTEGILADSMDVLTKGTSLEYYGVFISVTSFDLSFNSLAGEIPERLVSYFTLTGLNSLNLSGNHLSGNIPMNIGAMQALESLDLSINILSGEIPFSLSNLTFLGYLNFSYNNLSGRIPSGNQLQTFDESSYIGNSGLCGPPLSKNCSGNGITIPQGNESRKEDGSDVMSLYLGICIGFIFGLWLVFCVFLFKRKYRIAYFRATDDLYDWVYVFVVSSWKRAFGK
ncbi:hypothetical protein LUZ60_008495 [Juncus effusus]|nr:hypothetical protein LUZ60_008495 [Juncus effusus]